MAIYCFELARKLAERGEEVAALVPRYPRSKPDPDVESPLSLLRWIKPQGSLLCYPSGIWGLACAIPYYQPDVIIVGDRVAQRVVGLLLPILKLRLVVITYGSEILLSTDTKRAWLFRPLFRNLMARAEKIIAISSFTRQLLVSRGVPSDKIYVIPPGIDVKAFRQKPLSSASELRSQLGLHDEMILLTLARLDPRKGHDLVLRALPEVRKRVPNVTYIIAGIGPDRERLVALAQKLGISEAVRFVGYVPDDQKIDYYDLCDIFVMPSRQEGPFVEGFGISLLEAALRGKPSISSDHGGIRDIIEDERTGLCVDPYKPSDLARAILRLLEDTDLRKSMGEAAQKRVETLFDWERIVSNVQWLLKQKED